jgi:ornithine cyclodeaminase
LIQLTDPQVRAALDWRVLAARIEDMVARDEVDCAPRAAYDLPGSGTLLLMPAWRDSSVIGLKTVTVWPDNHLFNQASHSATYMLMDARSGAVLAVMEAHELTVRRTAAVSAIATRRLVRPDARQLLVIGTGPVAAALVDAYAALLPFDRVQLYGRDRVKAAKLAAAARDRGLACEPVYDLEAAARTADVISMATSAQAPLLHGDWLRHGTHVDLVGGFTPAMRETDDRVMALAAGVWVDTLAAIDACGDLIDPIASGALEPDRLGGTLRDLIVRPPARSDEAITIFKAVGYAVPDFAAAQCALEAAAPVARPAARLTEGV